MKLGTGKLYRVRVGLGQPNSRAAPGRKDLREYPLHRRLDLRTRPLGEQDDATLGRKQGQASLRTNLRTIRD